MSSVDRPTDAPLDPPESLRNSFAFGPHRDQQVHAAYRARDPTATYRPLPRPEGDGTVRENSSSLLRRRTAASRLEESEKKGSPFVYYARNPRLPPTTPVRLNHATLLREEKVLSELFDADGNRLRDRWPLAGADPAAVRACEDALEARKKRAEEAEKKAEADKVKRRIRAVRETCEYGVHEAVARSMQRKRTAAKEIRAERERHMQLKRMNEMAQRSEARRKKAEVADERLTQKPKVNPLAAKKRDKAAEVAAEKAKMRALREQRKLEKEAELEAQRRQRFFSKLDQANTLRARRERLQTLRATRTKT